MKKGTQAMLDAAKDDATLLPLKTVFLRSGQKVIRNPWLDDDSSSVYFSLVSDPDKYSESSQYYDALELSPAKKSKPKKWQNGTQAQLDAAKDDARLIPKKTYFKSKSGETFGMRVYKIDNECNTKGSVAMFENNGEFDFHAADDLEPIND